MKKSVAVFLLTISLFLYKCANLSTLQTPKVLDHQNGQVGFSFAALAIDHFYCCAPETYIRYGFYDNFDAGIKTGLFYITGDIKYQLFSKPFYAAIDFSISRGGRISLWGDNTEDKLTSYSQFSPMLILGTENIFTGTKIIYSGGERNIHGVFCGASIGSKFSILPVLNIYFLEGEKDAAVIPNIGFQWKF